METYLSTLSTQLYWPRYWPMVKITWPLVGCAGGAPGGRWRYWLASRTLAALSQSAVALPTGGMWPRNRTPSYNNTPFKQSTEERKAGPGGVSSYVSFSWRGVYCQGFFLKICVFESRRLHFWHSSGTWLVFAPIGTSFRLLSRAMLAS